MEHQKIKCQGYSCQKTKREQVFATCDVCFRQEYGGWIVTVSTFFTKNTNMSWFLTNKKRQQGRDFCCFLRLKNLTFHNFFSKPSGISLTFCQAIRFFFFFCGATLNQGLGAKPVTKWNRVLGKNSYFGTVATAVAFIRWTPRLVSCSGSLARVSF